MQSAICNLKFYVPNLSTLPSSQEPGHIFRYRAFHRQCFAGLGVGECQSGRVQEWAVDLWGWASAVESVTHNRVAEVGQVLDVSQPTAMRDLRFARAWLAREGGIGLGQ